MSKTYQGNFRYKRPSEGEYNLIANFISLGNYFIYFDGVELDNNSILSLHQSGKLFTDNFKLGSTLCREVDLTVLKSAVSEHPSEVVIKDVNNVVKFTLQVDSVDDTNIDFYDYVLVDKMVNLNQVYDYSGLSTINAGTVLNAICQNLLSCPTPAINYGSTIPMQFDETVMARDVVSYIAEINGCFAKIDETGNLKFVKFQNTDPFEVSINSCADISIGEYHKIERVHLDLGTASYSYPETYTGNYNTLYLNSDNVLITDSGNFTIEGIVQHIYNEIKNFEFYSLSTSRCAINQDSVAGDQLVFTLNGESYPTIAQIDWDLNIEWYGGYECVIDTKKQEETQIVTEEEKIRKVSIKVDRANGVIEQVVSDAENHTGYFGIYLNTEDPDAVVSVINQSADNIILNTKSLIFGVYPSGQYVEVKNYYSNGTPIGVTFDGTGYVRFQPQNQFFVRNLASDGSHSLNVFAMNKSGLVNQPYIEMINYDDQNGYIQANFVEIDSHYYTEETDLYNRMLFRNNVTSTGTEYPANTFTLEAHDSQNIMRLRNYKSQSSSTATFMVFTASASSNSFNISNYDLNDNNNANSLSMSANSSSTSLSLTNYKSNSVSKANLVLMTGYPLRSGTNQIQIENYDVDGDNIANYFKMSKSASLNTIDIAVNRGGELIGYVKLSKPSTNNLTISLAILGKTVSGTTYKSCSLTLDSSTGNVDAKGTHFTWNGSNKW